MKFYGVYGKNGGGIYTNWSSVLKTRPYVESFKNKAFKRREEAMIFVIDGLEHEYGVIDLGVLTSKTFEKWNWFYRLSELETK